MTDGRYADGRTYRLPVGWSSVPPEVLDDARRATTAALAPGDLTDHPLVAHLRSDTGRRLAMLHRIDNSHPREVDASDLLAASLLAGPVGLATVEAVLTPRALRGVIAHQLAALDHAHNRLVELDAAILDAMWDLKDALRAAAPTDAVTLSTPDLASCVCARRMPELFPLLGEPARRALGLDRLGHAHEIERFAAEVQVCAYLMSDAEIRGGLGGLHLAVSTAWPDLVGPQLLPLLVAVVSSHG